MHAPQFRLHAETNDIGEVLASRWRQPLEGCFDKHAEKVANGLETIVVTFSQTIFIAEAAIQTEKSWRMDNLVFFCEYRN